MRPAVRSPPVSVYVAEEFSAEEADILRRYFTNLDGPVFALVNLPEVVKGALFARYKFSNDALKGFSVNLGLDYMGSAPGEQASGVTAASTAAKVIPNQPSLSQARCRPTN